MDMQHQLGDTAYHKASGKRVVIVRIIDENNLEVKDSDMKKHECITQELISQQEHDDKIARENAEILAANERRRKEIEDMYGL